MGFSINAKTAPKMAEGLMAEKAAKATRERAVQIAAGKLQTENTAPRASEGSNSVDQPSLSAQLLSQPTQEGLKAISDVSTPTAEGQSATSEAPASLEVAPEQAPAASTPPAQSPLSTQYAQLARKERAIRQQMQELKRIQQEVKDAQSQIKSQAAQPQQSFDPSKYVSIDELKANPWQKLTETGISYDQLTQAALNAPNPLEWEIKKLQNQLADQQKSFEDYQQKNSKYQEDNQKQAYDQAKSQIKSDVKRLVTVDSSYETIKATNSVQDVVDLIEKTFERDGVLLTIEEAAQEVENYLLEETVKIYSIPKIQKRVQSMQTTKTSTASPKQPEKPPGQQPNQQKTLTNSLTSSRPLSARERAIRAATGQKS